MKKNKILIIGPVMLVMAATVFTGCQTPSDRDAGKWDSDININVYGSTNTVSVTIDSAGNTLAASSRDETKTATQTTDVKPDTAVSWGSASATLNKSPETQTTTSKNSAMSSATNSTASPVN